MKSRIKILIAAIFSLSLIGGSIFLEPKIDAQPALAADPLPSHYDETPDTVYPFVTYDGNPKPLVTAGVCSTGTVEYKLDADGTYSTSIPTAVDAGVYLVYYRVKGNEGYADIEEKYTFGIIEKAECQFTAPTAIEGLTDEDEGFPLINPGEVVGGTIYYREGTKGEYSTEVPTVLIDGTFTIYYKVEGDKNHNDIEGGSIVVTVTEATPGDPSSSKGGVPVWMIPTIIFGTLLAVGGITYVLGFFVFNKWIQDGDKLVRVFKLPGKEKTKVVSMMMQFKEVKPEDIKKSKKDFK